MATAPENVWVCWSDNGIELITADIERAGEYGSRSRDIRVSLYVPVSGRDDLRRQLDEKNAEIERLNKHCDKYEDAMLKERRLAEEVMREHHETIARLTRENKRLTVEHAEALALRDAALDTNARLTRDIKERDRQIAQKDEMLRNLPPPDEDLDASFE